MILIVLNILAGTTAATVYSLWASKWASRHCVHLAVLNALIAVTAAAVAFAYILVLVSGSESHVKGLRSVVSLILLLPALTRMGELRREQRREAVAVRLERELDSIARGTTRD